MVSTSRFRDWILLLICNLIWASQFVLVAIIQRQMGPVFATFFPLLLATAILVPIVHWEKKVSPGAQRRNTRRDIRDFILLGVVGQVGAQLFVTWGVRLSLPSNAALLMLALPVCTAVMAYMFLGERMTLLRWISFILAIAGVIECSGINWHELNFTNRQFMIGNLMIFLSVNGSAFYNTYSKKVLGRYSPMQVLLYSYYALIVFMLPITLYAEPGSFAQLPHFSTAVWVGLLLLALLQYGLAMVLFLTVLTDLDATQAALSNYLIPFFGVIIAALVFPEQHLTKFMLLGGALVLASTVLITIYEHAQSTRHIAATADGRSTVVEQTGIRHES